MADKPQRRLRHAVEVIPRVAARPSRQIRGVLHAERGQFLAQTIVAAVPIAIVGIDTVVGCPAAELKTS